MPRSMLRLMAIALLALPGCHGLPTNEATGMPVVEASSVAPTAPDDSRRTEVTIDGRHLTVNAQPFTVRGVGYAPTPIGDDPEAASPYGDYFTPTYSEIPERDLPLLRAMGANTIRLWGWDPHADHTGFLDSAYNGGSSPLYVIAGFWFGPPRDISQPADRQALVAEFREMVALHKDHPAILMWAIGNELNAPWMFGDSDELFSLIDEMAQAAHEEEGPGYHPVTTPLADVDLLATIAARDAEVPHLDVWSVQPYRGASFGSLFDDYAAVSEKPLVVTEYGIDAYDDGKGDEYEAVGAPYQALYAAALWGEVVEHADVCSGASIMAYSDEWWKGKHGIAEAGHPECPDLDPALHSDCGYAHSGHPDRYANEEWWGIMRTVDNGEQPDVMQPRTVYYTLQSLWLETSYLPMVLHGG